MRHSFRFLVLAVFGVALAPLVQSSVAQEVTIRTSADNLGGSFFGEGVIQVIIINPDADNDSVVEDTIVDIDADSTGSQGSASVTVPETSDSSGRFEFYLVHSEADAVDPSDLDGSNSAGIEGDGSCVSDCAPIVTFGPSGDLQIDSDLYDEVDFDITASDSQITVKYEEKFAQLELDRSAYGSNSFVYVTIIDQDANLNPSSHDEFTVDPNSFPDSDLLELVGGSIEDSVTFKETGDNSARFEGRYEIGSSMTFDSEALVLTVFDKANYEETLDAEENGSHSTDEVSFTIGNTDGSISGGGQQTWDGKISADKNVYAIGENVNIKVEDADANASPSVVDKISLVLSTRNETTTIPAVETGEATGIFLANFTLNEDGSVAGTPLKLDASRTIQIKYTDKKPADYAIKVQNGDDPAKEFTTEIKILPGMPAAHPTSIVAPSVKNSGGSSGAFVTESQLGLGTIITNNNSSSQSYVVLLEVRDSAGITVYLTWQSGTLSPAGSSTVGVSWIPELAGKYQVRAFAISGFEEADVISELATSDAIVS